MSSDDAHTWFQRYLRVRRPAEIGFWVVVMVLEAAFNTAVLWMDLGRPGMPAVAGWHLVAWEGSSHLAIALLIPALIWYERRFPLRWATLPRNLAWHLAGSAGFSLAHVGLMLAMRCAAYALAGSHYSPDGGWASLFFYEYLKDVRTYGTILLTVLGYRLLMLRLQGEARVLDAPEPPAGATPPASPAAAPPPPARPERFLVRKLRSEFLIAANDIESLQAQGNYVGLHVNGHDYLLRSTLADFLAQLDPARFARVHRSHAVNLDRVAEIEPLDSGDARLRMHSGARVPCSRRYRDGLARAV